MKNKAAVSLGQRRWKGKTKAQMRAHMKMMADRATAARAARIELEKNLPANPATS